MGHVSIIYSNPITSTTFQFSTSKLPWHRADSTKTMVSFLLPSIFSVPGHTSHDVLLQVPFQLWSVWSPKCDPDHDPVAIQWMGWWGGLVSVEALVDWLWNNWFTASLESPCPSNIFGAKYLLLPPRFWDTLGWHARVSHSPWHRCRYTTQTFLLYSAKI